MVLPDVPGAKVQDELCEHGYLRGTGCGAGSAGQDALPGAGSAGVVQP